LEIQRFQTHQPLRVSGPIIKPAPSLKRPCH
jgi:hypothetical protein